MLTRAQALKNVKTARQELDDATEDANKNHGGAETDWFIQANNKVNEELETLGKYYPALRFMAG